MYMSEAPPAAAVQALACFLQFFLLPVVELSCSAFPLLLYQNLSIQSCGKVALSSSSVQIDTAASGILWCFVLDCLFVCFLVVLFCLPWNLFLGI